MLRISVASLEAIRKIGPYTADGLAISRANFLGGNVDNIRDLKWADDEKKAARKAFQTAYERECRAIGAKLRQMMADDSDPQYLWRIHDYLSSQRRATDQKYDYRYSVLIQVFARLLSEGWLSEADLGGLSQDKIQRITSLANYFSGREE